MSGEAVESSADSDEERPSRAVVGQGKLVSFKLLKYSPIFLYFV